MLRSMASAITGLKDHQLYMDVVGNNIANVNTVGYKSSRINFKDAMSQTFGIGSAPMAGAAGDPSLQGGTNPVQLGLGVTVGAIDNVMVQGALTTTGKNTDLAIQGEGFFVLQGASGTFYSRDGAFGLDKDGYLVDPVSGNYVMGADPAGGGGLARICIDPSWNWSSFSISSDGTIVGVTKDGAIDTTNQPKIVLAKFNNPEGLLRAGGNMWKEGPNSGTADTGSPLTGGRGALMSGALEASNVDLAEQFSRMILAERGFQANSRVITTSDEMLQDLVNIKR